jgi:hypothetical protein
MRVSATAAMTTAKTQAPAAPLGLARLSAARITLPQ